MDTDVLPVTMLSNASQQQLHSMLTTDATSEITKLAGRKIWLPGLLYYALPWFYLMAGSLALSTTLFISGWFWVLPFYFLFSASCFHLGFVVLQWRRRRQDIIRIDIAAKAHNQA